MIILSPSPSLYHRATRHAPNARVIQGALGSFREGRESRVGYLQRAAWRVEGTRSMVKCGVCEETLGDGMF